MTSTSTNLDSDALSDRALGWLTFAGTLLGLAGIMRIVDSIWAFRYRGALPDGLKDATLGSELKTYGWLWLAVGCVLLLSSFLILMRSQLARWVGIFAAGLTAVSAVTWLPYFAVWSVVYIAMSVLALYALIAYGGPAESR
jgi:hypothetical protein